MKITAVDAIVLDQQPAGTSRPAPHGAQDPLIVRIRTDEGITGYGEADTFAPVARAIVRAPRETVIASGLAALLAGRDPLDEGLWAELFLATSFYGRGGVVAHTLAGVDLALWDIRGKAAGKPASALLGGRRRDRVRAYATTGMPASPADLPQVVAACREAGFTRVKFGLGAHPAPPAEHADLIAAARDAVGEQAEFMIDVGRRWSDADAAVKLVAAVERCRPGWIEEPFQPEDHAAYRTLTAASAIPISTGEADSVPAEYAAILADGVAIVQPDVCRAGGFGTCLEVERLALAAGRRCIPHEWGSGIAKAGALQLLAAMQADELFEYRVTEPLVMAALVAEKFPVTDGTVAVPSGPGLGITVDDELLDRLLADGAAR